MKHFLFLSGICLARFGRLTQENMLFIQHIYRWLCLRIKLFKSIWRKEKTKRGHLITSQTVWLRASVSEYTLQTSVFAACLAIIPAVGVHDSKFAKVCDSTHSQLFPMTIPPELCNSLLCWSSCDLPAHIVVSQGTQITTTVPRKKVPTSLQLHSSVPPIAMAPLPGSLPLQVFKGPSEQW